MGYESNNPDDLTFAVELAGKIFQNKVWAAVEVIGGLALGLSEISHLPALALVTDGWTRILDKNSEGPLEKIVLGAIERFSGEEADSE